MMLLRSVWSMSRGLVALLAIFTASSALSLASTNHRDAKLPFVRWDSSLAIADLDGDKQPDAAVLTPVGGERSPSHRHLDLSFSNRPDSAIKIVSSLGTQLSTRDIDEDNDIDVVIKQPFTEEVVQIWLNDGDGDFVQARLEDFANAVHPVQEHVQPNGSKSGPLAARPPTRRTLDPALSEFVRLERIRSVDSDFGFPVARFIKQEFNSYQISPRAPPLVP